MVSEDTSFDTADELMTCAREQALAAITKNINYNNENVEAVLFSAEGDALHQVLKFHPIPLDHCTTTCDHVMPRHFCHRSLTALCKGLMHVSTFGAAIAMESFQFPTG